MTPPTISIRKLACVVIMTYATLLLCDPITVCGECAYEVVGGGNFCTHCGASLKNEAKPGKDNLSPKEGAPAEPKAEAASPKKDSLVKCLEQDRRTAVALMAQNNVAGSAAALAALVNAKAIIALSGEDAISEADRKVIFGGILKARAALTTTLGVCPQCKGKGVEDVKREFSSLDGKTTVMKTGESPCRWCHGKGSLPRLRSSGDLRNVLADGRRKFADKALIAGRIKVGNAWVPQELAGNLSNREEAALRHFSADMCPECSGYGKTGCDSCDSTGIVDCPETDCENGLIKSKKTPSGNNDGQRITSIAASLPEPCANCRGQGYVACEACAGTGAISCRACKGSGERKPCAKCLGEGTAACRACKGTGKDKKGNECRLCKAEGIVLCPTCGGDGYGR